MSNQALQPMALPPLHVAKTAAEFGRGADALRPHYADQADIGRHVSC